MNHWSNGNQGWSGGPPTTDAVMTVSYVKAYFNTTNTTRTAQWSNACANIWEGRTCQLPDQTDSIDPTGPNGNQTGSTVFFSQQAGGDFNQTVYPGATAATSGGATCLRQDNRIFGVVFLVSVFSIFIGKMVSF